MKYEIGTSYAGIQVLLKVLDRVHRQSTSEPRVNMSTGVLLIITTNTGRTRRIPIVDSMSFALGSLYPEFFGPSQPVRLPKRVGYLAHTLLAVAIVVRGSSDRSSATWDDER